MSENNSSGLLPTKNAEATNQPAIVEASTPEGQAAIAAAENIISDAQKPPADKEAQAAIDEANKIVSNAQQPPVNTEVPPVENKKSRWGILGKLKNIIQVTPANPPQENPTNTAAPSPEVLNSLVPGGLEDTAKLNATHQVRMEQKADIAPAEPVVEAIPDSSQPIEKTSEVVTPIIDAPTVDSPVAVVPPPAMPTLDVPAPQAEISAPVMPELQPATATLPPVEVPAVATNAYSTEAIAEGSAGPMASTPIADAAMPAHLEGGVTPKMAHVTEEDHANAESSPPAPKFGDEASASINGEMPDLPKSLELEDKDKDLNEGKVDVVDPMTERPDPLAVGVPVAEAQSNGLEEPAKATTTGLPLESISGVPVSTGADAPITTSSAQMDEAMRTGLNVKVEPALGPAKVFEDTSARPSSPIESGQATEQDTATAFGIKTEDPEISAASEANSAPVALDTDVEPEAHEDPVAPVTASQPQTPAYVPQGVASVTNTGLGSAVDQATGVATAAGASDLTANSIEKTAIEAWNAPIPKAEKPVEASGLGTPEPQSSGLGSPVEPVLAGVSDTSQTKDPALQPVS